MKTVAQLLEICTESLKRNILHLPSGKYLTAGQNQFLTLWTRDFCHSIRGLLLIGEEECAKNHLSLLLHSLRDDGLVPRVLDNQLVQFRVVWQTAIKLMPILPRLALKEPLKPQYVDEHGSCAVDSNLLLLQGALLIKDQQWWQDHELLLKKVFSWYDDKFKNGLIWQGPFSDWQDSVKREGATFLTNLLYFLVASRLQQRGWGIELDDLKERIQDAFFYQGLYRTQLNSEIISLDGILLALEGEEFLSAEEKSLLWQNLLNHPLTASGLGVCSYPDYSGRDIAWHVKFAGLDGYHGLLAWSWLMGLGLKVAHQLGDQDAVQKQLELIRSILERDQVVMELYDPAKNWTPWESWLLKAENPFAWGSGYLIEGLKSLD